MGAAAFLTGERRLGDHQSDKCRICRLPMAFGERSQGRDGGVQSGLVARDAEISGKNGTHRRRIGGTRQLLHPGFAQALRQSTRKVFSDSEAGDQRFSE